MAAGVSGDVADGSAPDGSAAADSGDAADGSAGPGADTGAWAVTRSDSPRASVSRTDAWSPTIALAAIALSEAPAGGVAVGSTGGAGEPAHARLTWRAGAGRGRLLRSRGGRLGGDSPLG